MLLNVGLHADGPSIGLRLALMRRHGAYLLAQKDFHPMPQTEGVCDKNGLPDGADEIPYYTGHTENGRWALVAGGIHRLTGNLCLYEGVGYGRRDVAWEQYDGSLRETRTIPTGASAWKPAGFTAFAAWPCRPE